MANFDKTNWYYLFIVYPPNPVKWSQAHSTGPHPIQLVPKFQYWLIQCQNGQFWQNKLILSFHCASPQSSQVVQGSFNWSPNFSILLLCPLNIKINKVDHAQRARRTKKRGPKCHQLILVLVHCFTYFFHIVFCARIFSVCVAQFCRWHFVAHIAVSTFQRISCWTAAAHQQFSVMTCDDYFSGKKLIPMSGGCATAQAHKGRCVCTHKRGLNGWWGSRY